MKGKTLLKIVLPFLVLALGVAAAVVAVRSRKPPPAKPPVDTSPLVEVLPVHPADAPVVLAVYGTAQPKRQVEITPQVAGKVVELSPDLKAGGFVKEGDVLFRLDPRDYEIAVEKASADVALAEYNLVKSEEEARVAKRDWEILNEGKDAERPSPESLLFHGPQLKSARAAVAAAKPRLDEAKLALSRTWLVAPFEARVLSRQVELGQFAAAGKTAALLYATDAMEAIFPVAEADLAWLGGFGRGRSGRGPSVAIRADISGDDTVWQGRIVRTEGAVDAKTRTLNLVAEIASPYRAGRAPLLPGTFVRGEIRGETLKSVFSLPRHALHDGVRVYVAEGGTLRIRPVRVARLEGDTAYVDEGLTDGDRIILTRIEAVTDGMKVRLAPTPEASGKEAAAGGGS